jgi:hypothetical protein
MAKGSKSKPTINKPLLEMIVAATNAGSFHYVTQEEGMPLLQHIPPLIEVNTDMVEGNKAAARATDAGKAMVTGVATAPAVTNGAAIGVIKGAVLPPSKRGAGLHGGAPKQYPFDTMDVGDSFFVGVSEKHPNPLKTLGSTVSSANMRFAEETGEKKTVTRKKRGEDRKAVQNPDGSFVTETVELPVYNFTRKFEIRGVEAGKQYGDWTAPGDGALIARTK